MGRGLHGDDDDSTVAGPLHCSIAGRYNSVALCQIRTVTSCLNRTVALCRTVWWHRAYQFGGIVQNSAVTSSRAVWLYWSRSTIFSTSRLPIVAGQCGGIVQSSVSLSSWNPSTTDILVRILCGVARADWLSSGSTTSDARPGEWLAICIIKIRRCGVVDGRGEGANFVNWSFFVWLAFFLVIVSVTICLGSLCEPRASVLLFSSLIRKTRGEMGAAR